jgi:hypothetical protein
MSARSTVSCRPVAKAACIYLPLIPARRLAEVTSYVIAAHDKQAREPRQRFRKWDTATPYAIHPVWCATMLLTETTLPKQLRKHGAIALLQHDLLEDTKAELHPSTNAPERRLIEEMTFASFEEEVEQVWKRSPECRLLKCYDKVSNLLDMNWRTGKRDMYVAYTLRLITEARERYGELNIVKIASAICE